MAKPIAVIAGVGPGTGAALAHRFAQYYPVALLSRNPANYEPFVTAINSQNKDTNNSQKAVGFTTDVSSRSSLQSFLDEAKSAFPDSSDEKGDLKIAAAVFNVSGPFTRKPFLELTEEDMDKGYQGGLKAAFNFTSLLLPYLLPSSPSSHPNTHPPTIIYTGATASLRGSASSAAFATSKFSVRALAQSVAREYGPKGVHVAHVVVDGVIDIPRTKGWELGEEGKLDPDSIADTYWFLHTQPRTAFTFEVDLRPAREKW